MRIEEAIREFHQYFYEAGYSGGTWKNTSWLGIPTEKNPLDLWVYQEIIFLLKPDFIIEIGTCYGGSALFLASILDLLGSGRVLTVDIESKPGRPSHPRIEYLKGNSIDPIVVERVKGMVRVPEKVLVILDSNHFKDHVLAELRAYHGLVSVGSFMIVEDGNINGNPVNRAHGPGPTEALQKFLPEHPEFEVDRKCEKYFLTFNPGGYLRKIR